MQTASAPRAVRGRKGDKPSAPLGKGPNKGRPGRTYGGSDKSDHGSKRRDGRQERPGNARPASSGAPSQAEAGASGQGKRVHTRTQSKANLLKKQIRSLQRLLKRPNLPEEARAAKTQELSALEEQLKQHTKESQAKARAEKIDKRYKAVKFFEYRKIQRKMGQLQKAFRQADETERKAVLEEIAKWQADLDYVKNYPSGVKYVALFPKDDNEVAQSKRQEMRKKIADIIATRQQEQPGVLGEDVGGLQNLGDDDFFLEDADDSEEPPHVEESDDHDSDEDDKDDGKSGGEVSDEDDDEKSGAAAVNSKSPGLPKNAASKQQSKQPAVESPPQRRASSAKNGPSDNQAAPAESKKAKPSKGTTRSPDAAPPGAAAQKQEPRQQSKKQPRQENGTPKQPKQEIQRQGAQEPANSKPPKRKAEGPPVQNKKRQKV